MINRRLNNIYSHLINMNSNNTVSKSFSTSLTSSSSSTTTLSPTKRSKSTTTDNQEEEVIQTKHSNTTVEVTLNRPSKFNALNLDMVRTMHPWWDHYLSKKSPIKCIIMDGAGEKAFCAGGDVAAIQQQVLNPSLGTLPSDFFYEEYQLNYKIATSYEHHGVIQVSLWDGVTMGGGVGLSVHGKFRVATERALFAMPETGIGLFPDVGGTYELSRLRGGIPMGLYLALTGIRLGAEDCVWSGLATHYVPSSNIPDLKQAIINLGDDSGDVEKVEKVIIDISNNAQPPTEGKNNIPKLAPHLAEIERCFSAPTPELILIQLDREGKESEWAVKTAAILRKMSPTSVKITMEAVIRASAPEFTIGQALMNEYRLSQRFMRPQPHSDFTEGIRAVLVDKTHDPKWKPETLEEIDEDIVEEFFSPLDKNHLRGELML